MKATIYLNANVREGDSIFKQAFQAFPGEEGYVKGEVDIDFEPCLDHDLLAAGMIAPLIGTSRVNGMAYPVLYERSKSIFSPGEKHILKSWKVVEVNADVVS